MHAEVPKSQNLTIILSKSILDSFDSVLTDFMSITSYMLSVEDSQCTEVFMIFDEALALLASKASVLHCHSFINYIEGLTIFTSWRQQRYLLFLSNEYDIFLKKVWV